MTQRPPAKRFVSLRVSPAAVQQVDTLAASYGVTRSTVLRRLLTIGLQVVLAGRPLFPPPAPRQEPTP